MTTRIVFEPLAVQALAREPFMRAAVVEVTDAVEDAARAASPHRSGHFSRSFESLVDATIDGPVGRLFNHDAGAAPIEFGSVNNPPFAPMRKAVRSLGLRLEEDR